MSGRDVSTSFCLPRPTVMINVRPTARCVGPALFVVRARRTGGGRPGDGANRSKSNGGYKDNKKRRRGRPAWLRSPDDTPLRDGNRDRLMGLLTDRAAKTLLYYFSEMNPTLWGWFSVYLQQNEIPKDGSWDDVSGETFLRRLLSLPIEETRWGATSGFDSMYDCTGRLGVDPRNIAQRVMDIRSQIAKEMIQDLQGIGEENSLLMRETLLSSLSLSSLATAEPTGGRVPLLPPPDDSAAGEDD